MSDHAAFTDGAITQANRVDSGWLNPVNNLVYQGKNPSFVTSTGSANAYIVTLPTSLLTAPSDGQQIVFKANFTNTGAATLTVVGASSLGPIAIQAGQDALSPGAIKSGGIVSVIYANSVWNIISSAGVDTLISATLFGLSTAAPAATNSTALQAACNAVSSVYVPAGTYSLSSALSLNTNNKLWGPGTLQFTAALSAADACIQAVSKTNVRIEGLTVLGALGSEPTDVIQLKTCTKSKVLDCTVRYGLHEGISLNKSTYDCEVAGNIISNISSITGWGIGLFWDILRCDIHDNEIYDCGAYGIVLDDGTSLQTDNLPCANNTIHDNHIHTTTTGMWGIACEGSTDNDIHDNIIEIISTYGIDIHESNSATVFYPERNKVHDNIIRCDPTLVTNGIRLSGGNNNNLQNNDITAGDIGIVVTSSIATAMLGNVIEGNHIYECSDAGSSNQNCIQVNTLECNGLVINRNYLYLSAKAGVNIANNFKSLTISNNEISNSGREGIILSAGGTTEDLTVIGNKVVNTSRASAGTYYGISITASSASINKGLVEGNIFDDTQASPTLTNGVVMVGTAAVYIRMQVYNNIALKSMITPVAYAGSTPTGIYGGTIPRTIAVATAAVAIGYIEDRSTINVPVTADATVGLPGQMRPGNRVLMIFIQDGTGGWNITWNGGYKLTWSNTGNTSNKVSAIEFECTGAATLQQVGAQAPYA